MASQLPPRELRKRIAELEHENAELTKAAELSAEYASDMLRENFKLLCRTKPTTRLRIGDDLLVAIENVVRMQMIQDACKHLPESASVHIDKLNQCARDEYFAQLDKCSNHKKAK